jgi:hypothetical protein
MCGTPARSMASLPAVSAVASEPAGTKHAPDATILGERLPQPLGRRGFGKSAGIGVALAVVLLVPLFLVIHNWQSSPSIEPVAAVTRAQAQANSAGVGVRDRGHAAKAAGKTNRASAPTTLETEPTIPATETEPAPAELWKGVRSGSARAEVTLAKLYLEGNAVPQSCEQTYMLLSAASKKGYKPADSLLAGAYAERCQPYPTR